MKWILPDLEDNNSSYQTLFFYINPQGIYYSLGIYYNPTLSRRKSMASKISSLLAV